MSVQANNQPDCETLRALIPAYSVGATDPEENALVERLLPLCTEAAEELDEYRALNQALLYSVPAAQPPPRLHAQLMAAINAPPIPQVVKRPAGRLNRVIAALAVAALVISNVYWMTQVNSLHQEEQDLTALLHNQADSLAALDSNQAQRLNLVSTSGTDVMATVLWTRQSGTALLYTKNLPALTPDKAYQLWLIRGSQPVSAGVFQIDALGVGVLIIQSDQPISDFSALAISTEPASGSPQPTTTPIAAAQLS